MPAPFDPVAYRYDADFTNTPLGRRQRELVQRYLGPIIHPGMRVLELNCGTGERFLMETKVIKDNNIRFFVGYSGWSVGQLEEELGEASWLIDEMDANYLFRVKPFVSWQTVLTNKGVTYTVIAQMPDLVSLN